MNNVDLKYDILKEVFNISVGRAAEMLSEIVNRKIILKVPNLKFFEKEKEGIIEEYLPSKLKGTLMVSSISFKDNLTGKANLIFPADKMRTFINLCLQEEKQDLEFTDVDFDIIKEIGNIILNCIMGETGNYLDIDLNYSVPEVKVYNNVDFNSDLNNNSYKHIMLLYITFIIEDTEIEGAIIVDLTWNSVNEIMKRISRIEDQING